MRTFIRRHPVLSYYVLTFVISWGGALAVVGGPAGIPGTSADIARLMPSAIFAMLLGPFIAGLTITAVVDGRAGFRVLGSRLVAWRARPIWYAIALLTAPLVFMVALLGLSLASPVFRPAVLTADDKLMFLLVAIAPCFLVGFMEELGWTGVAIPKLMLRHGVVATGLIAGTLWGAWHLLTNDLWGGAVGHEEVPLALFLAINGIAMLVGQLVAFRILMVWVYAESGSLLIAILMHASLLFSTFALAPAGLSGVNGLLYPIAVGVFMWLVVAAYAVVRVRQSAGQSLRLQVTH
jgi:CAAX protease family protein